MGKAIIVFVLLPVLVIGDIFTERSFTVCNTNFVFKFEDDALSHTNKLRIADDIILTRSCWSNSVIESTSVVGFNGHIEDSGVDSPYVGSNITFPSFFTSHGTNNCLFIPRSLSQAYTNAFAFVDTNTNMYASAMRFVDLMVSGEYEQMPSNEFHKIIYQKGITPVQTSEHRAEIVAELKDQKFIRPSLLGISPPPSADFYSRDVEAIMVFPAIFWSGYSRRFVIYDFCAIWHDGMWSLLSPNDAL